MKCFICFTPYHIFNSLLLSYEDGFVDIILYDTRAGHNITQYAEVVSKTDLFSRVISFISPINENDTDNFKEEYDECIRELMNILDKGGYDELYMPLYDAPQMFLWAGIACLLGIKPIYYEEGEGSYIPARKTWQENALLAEYIDALPSYGKIPRLFLHAPEFADGIIGYDIRSIPHNNVDDILTVAGKIFAADASCPYRFLYMTGGECPKEMEERFVEMASGGEYPDFAVKVHPRQAGKVSGLGCRTVAGITPWEIMYPAIGKPENIVLISPWSIALMIPKVIYDKEPYLIILAHIPEVAAMLSHRNEREKMIDELKKLYVKPTRIYLPNSFNEVIEIIEFLRC